MKTKMKQNDWISAVSGSAIAGFLPMISESYAQWENKVVIGVNSNAAWTGLLKRLAEKTDWTKQADVDKFNSTMKIVQALFTGTMSSVFAFGIDSILDRKLYFNPRMLGISFVLGTVVRFVVPNPKRIPMTVSEPVNPYV